MKTEHFVLGAVVVAVAYLLYKDHKKKKCPCSAAAAMSQPVSTTAATTPATPVVPVPTMSATGRR